MSDMAKGILETFLIIFIAAIGIIICVGLASAAPNKQPDPPPTVDTQPLDELLDARIEAAFWHGYAEGLEARGRALRIGCPARDIDKE